MSNQTDKLSDLTKLRLKTGLAIAAMSNKQHNELEFRLHQAVEVKCLRDEIGEKIFLITKAAHNEVVEVLNKEMKAIVANATQEAKEQETNDQEPIH